MRALICRGKILNSEPWDFAWIEGYYVCLNGKEHRIYDGYAETDCGDYYPDYETVDPDTVGRYTGWTDKNGNLIFEGDILKREVGGVYGWPVLVDFEDGMFIWRCRGRWGRLHQALCDALEVVGNIYDNPEPF